MKFNLGELFCGPGGMAIASTLVKPVAAQDGEVFSISHSWGVDFSHCAIETFKANLGEEYGIEMDANKFVSEGLTSKRKINALAFGFPCNSFSSVGESEGLNNAEFGTLYKAGIKVLEAYDPLWFIAENVSGISRIEAGEQFKTILLDLANAGKGYNVVAHLYRFEEYGVPQARHRYVIVGIRQGIARRYRLVFRPPAPTHGPGRLPFVTVRDALANVANQTEWGGRHTRQSQTVVRRLVFTPPGENAWKLDEIVHWPDDKLDAYLREIPWYERDIAPIGDISAIRAEIARAQLHCTKARMSHIYRRLEADKPSYTITGSGGGGTHVYHWEEHRALTNEERAALQTFPPDFKFCGTPEQVRKQIGMAVPTRGAVAIFEAILKTFARIPYDHVEDESDFHVFPQPKFPKQKR